MKRIVIALAAALAVACAGPTIKTQRESSVPMPKNPTWAWGIRDTVSHYELDPAAESPDLHRGMQQAIENALAKKGWTRVDDPNSANLILTYHIGIRRTVEMQTNGTAYSTGWYGGYGWGYYGAPTYMSVTTTPVNYNEGALLVIIRDRASGQVAWNGLYKKEIQNSVASQQTLNNVATHLFDEM